MYKYIGKKDVGVYKEAQVGSEGWIMKTCSIHRQYSCTDMKRRFSNRLKMNEAN